MKATTQGMRKVREDRLNKAGQDEAIRRRLKDKEERLQREYAEMRKVVDFFYDNCPCDISDELKQTVEKTLFDGRGTRNKIGIVNFLDRLIHKDWPEWLEIAKKKFEINF